MKILITSDAHDRWDHLEKAVLKGNENNCEIMLFAGDLMSPGGVKILKSFSGKVHVVLGNNDGELVGLTREIDASNNITLHHKFGENTLREEMGGLSFYMNHYPDIARNAALTGNYDICVYGHDHLYYEETLENGTILLNPGEVQGYKTGDVTCMIFDTQTKTVERVNISQSSPT